MALFVYVRRDFRSARAVSDFVAVRRVLGRRPFVHRPHSRRLFHYASSGQLDRRIRRRSLRQQKIYSLQPDCSRSASLDSIPGHRPVAASDYPLVQRVRPCLSVSGLFIHAGENRQGPRPPRQIDVRQRNGAYAGVRHEPGGRRLFGGPLRLRTVVRLFGMGLNHHGRTGLYLRQRKPGSQDGRVRGALKSVGRAPYGVFE